MRVALIQSDGIAPQQQTRALHIARALRSLGHTPTLIVPQTTPLPTEPTAARLCQPEGFSAVPISAGHLPEDLIRFPRDPWLTAARELPTLLSTFDLAWFLDAEWAMPTLRARRFADRPLPTIVLDAPSAPDPVPTSLDATNRIFARRYAAQWADRICPLDADPTTLIPQLESLHLQQSTAPPRTVTAPTTTPAVTVCMAYFEEPDYLPEALLSLEHQTSTDFTVVVVDDGSHTPAARAAFDACAARYTPRGWIFIRQTNQYAGAAKNRAAREASTEFLLFLDADDIAAPNMVARFLRAALLSNDDCLVVPNYGFRDDPNGPCALLYDPPGNNLIGSMGDDMHGAGCIFIRTAAFHQLGGFTTLRGLSFDDYELHIRANLAGLRWDVLPELIYRYRMPRAQGVSRSTSAYGNLARVRRWYEALLPPSLQQLPLAFASAYWSLEHTTEQLNQLNRTLASRRAKPSPRGRELKLLLLACNFPYELSSGWHNRVQHLIAYLGSRFELTLMTSMPREMLAHHRKQTFRHLHAVLGVEGSNRYVATAPDTPFRVREHYTDLFQAAVRSLPTDQYHAAILDQIFMAEFRHDIDTIPVLTEHNIESRLLRQAARNHWDDDALPIHYRNALAEAELLERYEDRAWADIPLRAVVSDLDRAELDRRVPPRLTPEGRPLNGCTVVAPNGADPATWLPNLRFRAQTILFAGHLAYLPNVDAIDYLLTQIWPKVRKLKPNARLILAGRDPSPAVRSAIQQAGASKANIELCASPRSMRAIAARASISVAPLRLGSGTRVKILESLAWGLPVVSTTLGAEGIAVTDAEHLLLRDDPQDFAEAIARLLTDEPLWHHLRNTGRTLIQDHYSWDKVFAPLEEALLELIP